jgi:nucleotide-binding universal stress UspA family protein
MIQKILVPVDGSDTARKGLEYALYLAQQTGSKIILLSVINQAISAQSALAEAIPPSLCKNLGDCLKKTVEDTIAAAEGLCKTNGVESEKVICEGHPVEEILRGAKESGADLIVIGSHGRSALGAAFMGSVAIGVMHSDMKIPVLVVKR